MARKSTEEVMVVPRPGGKEAVYLRDADGNVTREIREVKAKRGAAKSAPADAATPDDSSVRSLSSESKGE